MSTSFNSSRRFPGSPGGTDPAQRELLISQLKAQILELKQNEREYFDLSSQLKKLEQRYSLLQDETARGEAEFKERKSIQFETIVNLRTDIDTLKSTLSETKLELQDLKIETQTVKELAEQKAHEAQRYRSEVADATEQNNLLTDFQRRLEAELDHGREEKRKLLGQIKGARDSLDNLSYKCNELEKVMQEMEYNNNKTERQNAQFQQTIDSLHVELKTKYQDLEAVEMQVADSQKNIAGIERDIQESEREHDRNRAEAQQKQKIYQQEIAKGLDLSARMAIAENTLKAREMELEELKREYENLKNSHSSLLDTNFSLKQELDSVQSDIETTSVRNSEIVEELDRLAYEDEQVRHLLNRRNRVEVLKNKSENQLKKSAYNRTRFSPSPERNVTSGSLRKSPLRGGNSLNRSPYKY